MIISGRITEWVCSLSMENKGHVEEKKDNLEFCC